MKHSFRLLLLFALSLLALTAVEAWAQPVATLRFQIQVPVTADVANRSIWSVQLFHAGVERNYLVPGPGFAGTTNYRVSVSPGENSTSIYIDKIGPGESYAAVRIIRASP